MVQLLLEKKADVDAKASVSHSEDDYITVTVPPSEWLDSTSTGLLLQLCENCKLAAQDGGQIRRDHR